MLGVITPSRFATMSAEVSIKSITIYMYVIPKYKADITHVGRPVQLAHYPWSHVYFICGDGNIVGLQSE